VTATRKIPSPLTLEQAQPRVGNYLRSWKVLRLTGWTVLEATQGVVRHQMSYWDALVWATAKLNQVATVLSEDFTDGMLLEDVDFTTLSSRPSRWKAPDSLVDPIPATRGEDFPTRI